MRFIAYDSFDERGHPLCGPDTANPWSRSVIKELLDAHPGLQMKPTDALLAYGEPFAYLLSWRYYFGYAEESNGPTHLRAVMKWLFEKPELLRAIRSGQATLVFIDWYEGVYGPTLLNYHFNDKFACFFNTFDLPPKHVIFADGNWKATQYERPQTPRYVYANIFESMSLGMYARPEVLEDPTSLRHATRKPLRFLSYARHWNMMRQYFTFDLFDRDLLKYGLVSCSAEEEEGSHHPRFKAQLDHWTPGVHPDRSRAFLTKLPMKLDADLSVNQATSVNVKHHLVTDISIIHETHANVESVFLSEKTYRALFLKHPFLMMGSPGLLAQLHRDGYETYGNIFDEAYDSETDLRTRKEMVLAELTKLIRMEADDRVKLMEAAQEIAAHNQRHFLRQLERPRFGHKLIEALKD